ncbi:MAG: 7-cyano-7-deazaguanine synthase QueC [Verrucomicrobiota bacterium]
MNSLVLLSGGMDSVTALYHAAQEHPVVAALSFDYGSKHNHREIPFARRHAQALGIPHQTVPLTFIADHFSSDLLQSGGDIPEGHYAEPSMKQTVVPFRNGIMLAIACGYAESIGAGAVTLAAHSGDHAIYPDCREPFMLAMEAAMTAGTYENISLLRPFIDWDKTRIAQRGAELGIDFSETWSCYKGGEIHCGVCGTCVERREAFLDANVPDPTVYQTTPELPPSP